jgi:uncharacterized membrane protein
MTAVVTSRRHNKQLTIIARPNQSASWRVNQLVLLALSIPSLGIAAIFALLGAWPILPLAGLELSVLGAALYRVNWKLQYRHIITLSEDQVRIDKGYYLPRRSWQLARKHTGISIDREQHPEDSPGICLHDCAERVPVGDFLNRDDCLQLLRLLREELQVRGASSRAVRAF